MELMHINSVQLWALILLIGALMFLAAPPYAGQQRQTIAATKTRVVLLGTATTRLTGQVRHE
jgi:hypothetical protein